MGFMALSPIVPSCHCRGVSVTTDRGLSHNLVLVWSVILACFPYDDRMSNSWKRKPMCCKILLSGASQALAQNDFFLVYFLERDLIRSRVPAGYRFVNMTVSYRITQRRSDSPACCSLAMLMTNSRQRYGSRRSLSGTGRSSEPRWRVGSVAADLSSSGLLVSPCVLR